MPAVTLHDHQPCWARAFADAAAELAPLLAGEPAELQHIGSTAVPGLCAKPVLDVLLGAPSLAWVEARHGELARLGYQYRPEHEAVLPQRRYHVRPESQGPRSRDPAAGPGRLRVHLHGVVTGGLLWRQHLGFRDALRADPALTAAYADLKQQLARTHRDDKSAYTEAKAPFIQAVLARQGLWPAPVTRGPAAA